MHFSLSFYFVVTTLCPKSSLTLVSSWNIAKQNSSTSQELIIPNPSIDFSSIEGSVISLKPIWRYLGFFFDYKLNFYYHMYYYATKCLFTLSADGDQREFDLKTRVTTNGNRIISEMFHSCALNK